MMKPIITKTGMVLAVAATAALPNLAAAADGWEYSGAHARASALQLDYFSLDGDIGNIWVNPALAKQHSNTMELSITDDDRQDMNRADSNVGRSGAGTDNGGVAGILHGLNDATTVGAYIGRDRADMTGFDIADGLNDAGLAHPDAGDAENPQNQFDIFYATGLDNMDIGVRFNYQAKEESASDPRNVSVSGPAGGPNTTKEAIVAQLNADYTADASNPPATPLDLDAAFGGQFNEVTTTGSSGWDASEMNIALGLNLFDGLDGSLQLGSADGSLNTNDTTRTQKYRYFGAAGSQVLTDMGNTVTNTKDSVSVDSGQSMALALRYQATDNLLTSFAYSTFDYGGALTRSTVTNDVTITRDANGVETNRVTTVVNDVETGSSVREGTLMALNAAYQIDTNEKGVVTVATGLVIEDLETGFSLNQARDNMAVTDPTANPVTTTTFNGPTGTYNKYMEEESSTMIPLTIALEQGLSDKWERWTLRGSVSKNIYETTEVEMTDYYFTTYASQIDANGDAIDGGRSVQQFSETSSEEEVWADRETTVRLGFGYTRGDFTVDTVFSATVDRLFTADHKILEDSKFGKVTVAYNY